MTTVAGPQAFFDVVYETFREAEKATGRVEHFYSIAGLTVCLRFAGPALEPAIAPALAHAAIEGVDTLRLSPSLVVCLWDSASSGVRMPAPPWSLDDIDQRGEIRHYCDGAIQTAFQLEGAILSQFCAERRTAIYWARDASAIPYYERGSPCRSIFNWWLIQHRRQTVHAGAVGTPAGCVLLAGKSGSGKSNTALGCLATRLSYLGDDYCVVATTPRPVVYSLYSTGKTHADDLRRLQMLASLASNHDQLGSEKALFFLHEHFPDKVLGQAPLRAVLMPRVRVGQPTRLAPASPVEALLSLAPSTTSQLPYAGAEVIRTLSTIVRQVPCYHLDLGTDGPSAPSLIASLLADRSPC